MRANDNCPDKDGMAKEFNEFSMCVLIRMKQRESCQAKIEDFNPCQDKVVLPTVVGEYLAGKGRTEREEWLIMSQMHQIFLGVKKSRKQSLLIGGSALFLQQFAPLNSFNHPNLYEENMPRGWPDVLPSLKLSKSVPSQDLSERLTGNTMNAALSFLEERHDTAWQPNAMQATCLSSQHRELVRQILTGCLDNIGGVSPSSTLAPRH